MISSPLTYSPQLQVPTPTRRALERAGLVEPGTFLSVFLTRRGRDALCIGADPVATLPEMRQHERRLADALRVKIREETRLHRLRAPHSMAHILNTLTDGGAS